MASRQTSKTVAALDVALMLAVLAVLIVGIWFGYTLYETIEYATSG